MLNEGDNQLFEWRENTKKTLGILKLSVEKMKKYVVETLAPRTCNYGKWHLNDLKYMPYCKK